MKITRIKLNGNQSVSGTLALEGLFNINSNLRKIWEWKNNGGKW